MTSKIISGLIWIGMSTALLGGTYYNNEHLVSMIVYMSWGIVFGILVGVLLPGENPKRDPNDKRSLVVTTLYYIYVGCLIITTHWFLAAMFVFSWVVWWLQTERGKRKP